VEILLLVFGGLVFLFSFVLLFGAPYLPTHAKQTQLSLELLNLKKGQTLYELGCGDGKVLIAAAMDGYRAVGYELNPLLFAVAWLRTLRYRKLVSVRLGNFWNADFSEADGVYVFLLDRFMHRLDAKLSRELKQGTRLVSYTFQIPGKKPVQSKAGLFVYHY
jgi:SAM-dependent methyltransferase